jgi:predicted ATPase
MRLGFNAIIGISHVNAKITGSSGTGKTSLAKSFKPMVVLERGGFFISAKFEQFLTRSAPYYPMQQAFHEFVQQVLHYHHHHHDQHVDDNDENITTPSTKTTTTTLHQEMQRIVDPIVAREPLLLNMLPPLKDLLSAEICAAATASNDSNNKNVSGPSTEHRLLQAFVRLIRAVCSPSRPLFCSLVSTCIYIYIYYTVICDAYCNRIALDRKILLYAHHSSCRFLSDDLQWADEACLNLLSMLVSSVSSNSINNNGKTGNSNDGLMILGACRGNEVSIDHDLAVTLREMEEDFFVRITDISLTNLKEDDIQKMLSDVGGLDNNIIPMNRTANLVS